MECVRMADIKDWKDMTLLDNWQVRRLLDLKVRNEKRLKFLTAYLTTEGKKLAY